MRVLIACEFSGIVRDAFRRKGHEAYSCDVLPTEKSSLLHYQCDIMNVIDIGWDLMIAHPPCTYLSQSGVRWLYTEKDRLEKMIDAAMFFNALLDADIPKIAIENPVMNGYAQEIIGQKQNQIIQPWQFGHGEIKKTCLWLKGLPLLKPTNIVNGREAKIHRMNPGKDRSRLRSITYKGIAEAMAGQWGSP